MLVTYGTAVLQQGNVSDVYRFKYKGIWICLQILTRTLAGNYVNFGVFGLYGDPALKVGRRTLYHLDIVLGLYGLMFAEIMSVNEPYFLNAPLSELVQDMLLSQLGCDILLHLFGHNFSAAVAFISLLQPEEQQCVFGTLDNKEFVVTCICLCTGYLQIIAMMAVLNTIGNPSTIQGLHCR